MTALWLLVGHERAKARDPTLTLATANGSRSRPLIYLILKRVIISGDYQPLGRAADLGRLANESMWRRR